MNIDDIKKANAEAGLYFFSEDTLRFFSSRTGTTVYGVFRSGTPGGQYFITSERDDCNSPRMFTVRRYDPVTHDISTVGNFKEYKTSQGAAKRAMRERDREQATGDWKGKED